MPRLIAPLFFLFLISSPAYALVATGLGCSCPCDDDFSTPEIGYLDGYPTYEAWDLGPVAGGDRCAGTSLYACNSKGCTCDFLLIPLSGSGDSKMVQRRFECGVGRDRVIQLFFTPDTLLQSE